MKSKKEIKGGMSKIILIGIIFTLIIGAIVIVSALTTEEQNALVNELNSLENELSNNEYKLVNYLNM